MSDAARTVPDAVQRDPLARLGPAVGHRMRTARPTTTLAGYLSLKFLLGPSDETQVRMLPGRFLCTRSCPEGFPPSGAPGVTPRGEEKRL